ncbi:MAG TPA: hypothetical protein VN419_09035 [Humidesulfovibrio sp.]|uniref:hypothetical protein n=1 Tax=Humidesulfovibrio sp. TaxID=2910988 RepID=UPI002BB9676B|nr:hypothetical protein [Humidesulfovibrio sp.]HWR04153.1 hypothetical protein [Humidesulfovibrio sp.]
MKLHPLFSSPLAALAPPLVLALCVRFWAVDVLNWDEWLIWAGVLQKLQTGALTLADLAVQQNEQRNLAARLFGLLLLPAFGLNRLAECALIIMLAGGSFLLAARLYTRTAGQGSAPAPLLVFSLLCFSLLQWETFSVGINSSVVLPPLGMWTGAVLATPRKEGEALTWARLGLMVLTGLIPSFSFVNGLFYWICLTPLVLLNAEGKGQKLAKASLFALAGALVWAAYFHGYTSPPHHPSPLLALTRPIMLGGYFLAYLGGALAGDRNLLPLAMLGGGAGLGLLLLLLRTERRQGWRSLRQSAPWLAVAAFSLLSALATAVGRSGFGMGQALESRYSTFSTPLWVALVALLCLRGQHLGERTGLLVRRILAGCLALFLLSSVLSAIVLRNRAPRLAEARAELFRCTDPQKLEAVFPDPAYVVRELPLFLQQRAAMYRDIRPLADYAPAQMRGGDFELKPDLGVSGRVCGILFSGQRVDGQAGLVFLALPERIAAVAQAEADGRFALFVPDNALPEGECLLRAYALDKDKKNLLPLDPPSGVAFNNTQCPPPALHLEKYFHVR